MKKCVWLGAFALLAAIWSSAPAKAQVCVGDCNNNQMVVINELVTCVNIALGSAQLSTCTACDGNGNGMVAINELVTAVNNALEGCGPHASPTPTVTPGGGPVCGNHVIEAPETCDDGNTVGGDGCAANCTTEDARLSTFDKTKTVAYVQAEGFPVQLNLSGSQTFLTGKARTDDTIGGDGKVLFKAGEIPVAIKAVDVHFPPVSVPGLVCACVRGVPLDSFGVGVSAKGIISCNDEGLSNIDYVLVQDHSTLPGSSCTSPWAVGFNCNDVMGTPDDPTCSDVQTLPGGTMSAACSEQGGDEECSDPTTHVHKGVCNGPRTLTQSGAPAGKGSAFILNNTSISLLGDNGDCNTTGHLVNGKCPYKDYGDDCLPCTADDAILLPANNIPTTTGTASASVYDANLDFGGIIAKGQFCPPGTDAECLTEVTGHSFDCDALQNNPNGGLSGGALVVAFPSIDAKQIGDNTTTTVFFSK